MCFAHPRGPILRQHSFCSARAAAHKTLFYRSVFLQRLGCQNSFLSTLPGNMTKTKRTTAPMEIVRSSYLLESVQESFCFEHFASQPLKKKTFDISILQNKKTPESHPNRDRKLGVTTLINASAGSGLSISFVPHLNCIPLILPLTPVLRRTCFHTELQGRFGIHS